MSLRRFEQVESRPAAENQNRTPQNVWNEVYSIRRNSRRVEPRQERTEQPKREADAPRPEADTSRRKAEPKSLDCSQGCPLKNATSARSEMRSRESAFLSKSDAQLLRNFDPSKGPMSERLMTAIEKLRKHAMDVGPDGKPLWTSMAPTNPEARTLFKDHLFAGNPEYRDAQEMRGSGSGYYAEVYRNYGENFQYGDAAYVENPTPYYNTRTLYGDGK